MALEAEILRLTNLLSDCQCKKSKPPVMETRSTCTNSNKKQSQTKSKRPNWFQRLFCCCCYESEPETLKTQTSKPYSSLENLKNSKQVHPHSSVENLKTRKQVHPHSSIENLKQSQISAPKANAKVIETLNVSKPSNDIIKPSPSAKSAMKASESNNSKFTLNVNVEDSDSDSDSEIMNKRRGSNSKAFAF
ncbi:hypothetical protein BC833DRAFT_78301 [Globomyces pollinis-pini]|nr:hypothetical protein BC833DRAFT_78301 [Globomyces pollinis-pini]